MKPEGEAMRVTVYELRPGDGKFVLDKSHKHCIIAIKEGRGSFLLLDPSRQKLIQELFDGLSSNSVSGGKEPERAHWDAIETHPAWSVEVIEAIIKEQLFGFNMCATIEYEERMGG